MSLRKAFARPLFSALVLFLACSVTLAQSQRITIRDAAPGSIMVKFKPGRDSNGLADVLPKTGLNILQAKKSGKHGWWLIKVADTANVDAAVAALRSSANVAAAEPDYRLHALETTSAVLVPNDPRFTELWGMRNTGQSGGTAGADINAVEAWGTATSSSVLVAVIDTGVDRTHPDLAANMWVNTGEIPNNGIDDDHNGFVDDYYGWDFAYGDNDPTDGDGHGTHVAGTIGAVGNNSVGVVGVCWNVKIMAVKFMDNQGYGDTSAAIEAIDYAVAMGAKVLSNSWGGGGFSQALYDSISAANDAGVIFIAAAGNDSLNNDNSFSPDYPSSYDLPNIISVAATTNTDGLAYFSNYGATTVDLGAPGMNILSCWPGNHYQTESGTSMATPHVSGACALVWGLRPELSVADLKQLILSSTDPIPALLGKCVSGGRLNVGSAMDLATVGVRLTITAPNGGESFQQGYTTEIAWNAIGFGWNAGDKVNLQISSDGGGSWTPIAGGQNLPYDQGTFTWTIADAPGSQYMVQVVSVSDSTILDQSDSAFIISGPPSYFDVSVSSPQYDNQPVSGTCTITAKDAGGRTVGTFGQYETGSLFPITVSSPDAVVSGLSGPGDVLTVNDFTNGVADLVAKGAVIDVAAPPMQIQLQATSADSQVAGTSSSFSVVKPPDFFTENFETADNDLSYLSIHFTPASAQLHYTGAIQGVASFPTDPTGGMPLTLTDDSYATVSLINGAHFPFYGTSYSKFYVGSNGYITFGSQDASYASTLDHHFSMPRISALLCDLNPAYGQITYKQLADRVAVTFDAVPQYPSSGSNSFQVELYFDGSIVLSYLGLSSRTNLVGLSDGMGVPANFRETDFSAYPIRPTYTLTVTDGLGSGAFAEGDVATITAQPPEPGLAFSHWTGDTQYVADANSAVTTVTMPAAVVAVAAQFVPALTITYPTDAGLGLEMGEKVNILWQVAGLPKNSKLTVTLSDGHNVWTLANNVSASKGKLRWTVGSLKTGSTPAYPDGDGYQITLTTSDGQAASTSANAFSIGKPVSLDIQVGQVLENSSTPVTCIAHYDYGPDRVIPASDIKWSTSTKDAKMGKNGLLVTKSIPLDEQCAITAVYQGKTFNVQTTRQITILNLGP